MPVVCSTNRRIRFRRPREALRAKPLSRLLRERQGLFCPTGRGLPKALRYAALRGCHSLARSRVDGELQL